MAKVILAISGGVDSSVCAYLLQKQGHQVSAIFMKNWDSSINHEYSDPHKNDQICQSELDYQDAQNVCAKYSIPITKVDFIEEYWNKVFKIFLQESKQGLTPNPDILCNKEIKFKQFIDHIEKNYQFDYLATGHYANIEQINGKFHLTRGLDQNKDQTYFLSQINPDLFPKLIFPIGKLKKEEVRAIAEQEQLINAHKRDSTGICFIGKRNFNDFLANYLKPTPGDVINIETGLKIGTHQGLFNHTIGQRKGLGKIGITAHNSEAFFVAKKDPKLNILYICQGSDNINLKTNQATIINLNPLGDLTTATTAKFRYRTQDIPVTIEKFTNHTLNIKYPAEIAVTLGQQAVFYHNNICLGGGQIIEAKLL